MTPPPASRPLPCGTDLGALVAQVADGVDGVDGVDGDLAHQATCPHCQAALAELGRLWALMADLAAERVAAPARIDEAVMLRIRRAMFAARVASFLGGLFPRLGWALLTYSGLGAAGPR